MSKKIYYNPDWDDWEYPELTDWDSEYNDKQLCSRSPQCIPNCPPVCYPSCQPSFKPGCGPSSSYVCRPFYGRLK